MYLSNVSTKCTYLMYLSNVPTFLITEQCSRRVRTTVSSESCTVRYTKSFFCFHCMSVSALKLIYRWADPVAHLLLLPKVLHDLVGFGGRV